MEHLQNYGTLGAGNLIILCEYHHDFLGDRLDRREIVRKLRTATKATRKFGEKKTKISGKTIDIALDVQPYKLVLFFTDAHALAWLDRASDDLDNLTNDGSTVMVQKLAKHEVVQSPSPSPAPMADGGHVTFPNDKLGDIQN